MSRSGHREPEGEALRQAIRWIAEQGPCRPELLEEAARRFDLSPRDEEFLLRHFRSRPPDTPTR